MPDRGEGAAGDAGGARRRSRAVVALILVVGVLVVLMAGLTAAAGLWTDRLWYRAVHYGSVFSTVTWTRAGLFAVFGLAMAGGVGGNMYLAYRLRPPLSAMSGEQQSLDRYRMGLAPYRAWALIGVCGMLGVIAGGSAASHWRLWLLMANSTPFHTEDPQFHKDVSFYTFELPWYRFLVTFGFAVVILSLLGAALVHYLYGGLRLTAPGAKATSAATGHLAVLLGFFVSLKAAAYWLDRYSLAVRSSGFRSADKWTGLRYVDANAYLPAKTILFFIAVICASLFFATLWRRTWTLPTVGFGLLVLSAVLIGGLYPAIVQKFEVLPNEAAKEAPYVQKNLDATRSAYGLDKVEVSAYPGAATATATTAAEAGRTAPAAAGLRDDADTVASLRVLDPDVVSPTFQELQETGDQYQFPSTLDVDRYPSKGTQQDTVVGVRELNVDGIPKKTWINDHVKYTHGYGLVAADGAKVDARGAPVFGGQDIPAAYRRQIYYGEGVEQYSIVGGSTPELDYSGDGREAQTHYRGKGGVSLSGSLTRAAYAVSLGDPRIFYSGAVDERSRILYNRTPKERVAAVAPWLTIDGDAYPTVVGGKVLWVVDGYTTSDSYPYATRTTLAGATADSQTDGRHKGVARQRQINYIRNSVKATVDAYDGTVTLYQWDTRDPVLKTWMKAFPHTVRPKADIPPAVLAHLRYPQDLFKVQRQMLTSYHVTKAADFAGGSQVWAVPDDPAAKTGKAVPPSYMSLKMPGLDAKSFSLTTTFTPRGKSTLSAFMAVDADATSPDYGTIRLLRMPSGVDGPGRVQSKINAESRGAAKRSGADSTVEYGDLLTVPLDGDLLYVEPVYVRAKDADGPLLGGVAALYGGRTAFEPTLSGALDALFPPPSAAHSAGDAADKAAGGAGDRQPADKDPADGGGTAGGGAGGSAEVRQALSDAQKAFDDSQAAMKKGDWDAYGAAQERLADALERARAAEGSAAPDAPPSATPSTSAAPVTPGKPSASPAPTTAPPGERGKG